MCVIIHCETSDRPDFETLEKCEVRNPHGIGLAWRESGKLRYWKTNDLISAYDKAISIKGEMIIHLRWASAGGVCNELRHPFPITRTVTTRRSGSAKTLLFQNGTVTGWRKLLGQLEFRADFPEGEISDTRLTAYILSLPASKGRFRQILGMLSEKSRWVIMGNRTTRIGAWHSLGDLWFSNLDWETPPTPRKRPVPRLGSGGLVGGYAQRRAKAYWKHFEKGA